MERPKRVWTVYRKAMGNLLPALLAIPPMVVGTMMILKSDHIFQWGLALVALGPVIGWVAANYLGLFQNAHMKAALTRRLFGAGGDGQDAARRPIFVGMARPDYHGLLDPHEDLGFLIIHADQIDFRGELHEVALKKTQVKGVRRRFNPHSLLGLGGWVSVEGIVDGQPVRLLIEPRERGTLLANAAYAKQLVAELSAWLK